VIGSYKMDPLTFTGMVYDPHDALNRTGFEHPFSQGVTFRGSVDLSSQLFSQPRTDGFAFAVSSEKGTDFASLPYANRLTAPEFDRVFAQDFLTDGLFGDRTTVPTEKSGRFWFGYSFEQTLWQSPTNPAKSWGLFGQTAVSDGNPNSLQWSVLGGIGGTSPLSGRPYDKFGVGLFYYGYSNELKSHLEPLVQLGDEYGAEIFYNFAITQWLKLTADAQAISPAVKGKVATPITKDSAILNNSTVVLLGLRTQITF
jgi:porin